MHRLFKRIAKSVKVPSRLARHQALHSKHDKVVPHLWDYNSGKSTKILYFRGSFLLIGASIRSISIYRWKVASPWRRAETYTIHQIWSRCSVPKSRRDLFRGVPSYKLWEKRRWFQSCVHTLEMDNNVKIIARIPFRHAGPPALITHFEVATIAYGRNYFSWCFYSFANLKARSRTSLPVPEILDWNGDPDNSVGTPYIIMKHALGVSLQEKWATMDTVQKIRCIERLTRYEKELAALKFPAFGSLYSSGSFTRGEEVIHIGSSFCIGPDCGTDYWPCVPREQRYYETRPPNRGPCKWAWFM